MPVITAVATPILGLLGVVTAAWIARKAGLRQADAAITAAEAKARETVTADWKAFSDSLQQRLTAVETRAGATEARLDAAEQRALVAEARAHAAEDLYKAAVRYLRQIAAWIAERLPDEPLPPPPDELAGEL